MFKKILFLFLLVPVAHSEILELTCEFIVPLYIKINLTSNSGSIRVVDDIENLKKGSYELNTKSASIYLYGNEDSYQYSFRFRGRNDREVNLTDLYINKKTHSGYIAVPGVGGVERFQGKCSKGIKEYNNPF